MRKIKKNRGKERQKEKRNGEDIVREAANIVVDKQTFFSQMEYLL